MRQLLNKSGMAHSMPKALILSDKRFSGLGLFYPYYLQQIKHVRLLFTKDTVDRQTLNLLNAAWEEIIWQSGTGGNLTAGPAKLVKITRKNWMKDTLLIMIKHDMTLLSAS